MTFVWKTTCRRLQSSGALARFAEGDTTDQERGEIVRHLASCPTCQSAADDALAVARILQACKPSVGTEGLAASGNLWAKLEAEVSRTPQDVAPALRLSRPGDASSPRLQRFGHWLATPGALPFGSVAAAAVVGMVGMVVYQRTGGLPVEPPAAYVTALEDSEITEVKIIPSPETAAPAAQAEQGRPFLRPRVALASDSATSAKKSAMTPLKREVSIKRNASARRLPSSRRIAGAPSLRVNSLPSSPRAGAVQVADKTTSVTARPLSIMALAPEAASVPTAAPPRAAAPSPVPTPTPAVLASGTNYGPISSYFGGGSGGGIVPQGPEPSGRTSERSAELSDAGRRETSSTASSSAVMAFRSADSGLHAKLRPVREAITAAPGSENSIEAEQDVPAVRSLMDLALQQRRQRSLFSYATR